MITDDLAALAAVREPANAVWQSRFAQLLQDGLVSVPVVPGAEIALAASAGMNRWSVAEVVRWLQRAAGGPLQAGASVALDLSAADNTARVVWRKALRGFLADVPYRSGRLSCSLYPQAISDIGVFTDLGIEVIVRYGLVPESLPAALAARSHVDARVHPVPAAAARALSVLHAAEKGQAVLPRALFEVRANSAWLLLDIDMRRLGSAAEVRQQLRHCLRFADNLIDVLEWPSPALRLDAFLNRRVALRFTCIGDVMSARGMRPGCQRSFVWLQRRLQFLRSCIVHESMLLAHQRGPFPDLRAADLVTSLAPRYGVREARRLLRNRLLRHRHLLTLSPLHLIPECADAAGDWLDLLPAISCADTIGFGGPDCRGRMSLTEWGRLLRLTAAIAANGVRMSPVRRYAD